MATDLSACIFCEELIPSDSEECPNCDKKPFSGMYFDPAKYKIVEQLEKAENWKRLGKYSMKSGCNMATSTTMMMRCTLSC